VQVVIGGVNIACNLAGTTQAVCTESQTLSGFSTTELVTSTLGPADISYFPVGVTAGAQKLGPASTGVSATATSTSGASTGLVGSISVIVSSTSGSGSATTTSTTELSSSSGETSATMSATGSSSISQTQSAATTRASSAAARAGRGQLSMLTTVVKCLVGGILGTTLL